MITNKRPAKVGTKGEKCNMKEKELEKLIATILMIILSLIICYFIGHHFGQSDGYLDAYQYFIKKYLMNHAL